MYEFCMVHELHNRAIDAANMVSITANVEDRIESGEDIQQSDSVSLTLMEVSV